MAPNNNKTSGQEIADGELKFTAGGKPTFLLGVNYWSRAGGPRMWGQYDEAQIRAELQQMRDIGLNTCRSFTFLPHIMPEPGKIDDDVVARMRRFYQDCDAAGLFTIPSFLVGHMSGENYDFVGQDGRSTYDDDEVLGWQLQVVEAVAGAAADNDAVIAYLASNEMPLWGLKSTIWRIKTWGAKLRAALRKVDPTRPFSLGDGVMNLKGDQNGFDAATLVKEGVIDFVGPHTYYADSDPMRQAMNVEYCLRSRTYLNVPLMMEEFGCSSCQVSEGNQARYYREVVNSCLSVGASGALGWCFSDFDLLDEPPYSHHAFELGFGVTRADGGEKAVCGELRKLSQLIEDIDFPALERLRPRAAIVVPSYFHKRYPFAWEDRQRMRRTLLQSYVLCTKAHFDVELVPETHDLSGYELILAPATQKLLSPTWRTLLERAQAGATVYWSYFSGDYNFHQGAWCANFEALTGLSHQLRYACFDLPQPRFALTPLTSWQGGDVDVSTEVGGAPYPRARLPVTPLATSGATVLARDSMGRAALTEMTHGNGRVIFCNHPLEYYLAEQADINARDTSEGLYVLLRERAGISSDVRCDQPSVQMRVVRSGDFRLLWLFNRAWSEVSATVESRGGTPLFGTDDTLAVGSQTLQLMPKQVNVYRLNS